MNVETLLDLFEFATSTHRKPDALLEKKGEQYEPVSSEELREKAQLVAAGLISLGIKKKDRVALLSENRPEWLMADLGIMSAGAINVPLFPTLPPIQIRDLLLDCEPGALFVSTVHQLEGILSIAPELPSLRKIILIENIPDPPHPVISFHQLLASGAHYLRENPGIFEEIRHLVQADDIATIIYTSGATGIPKGVMLSHGNIVANVIGCAEAIYIDPSDLVLSFLPLSHIFERTVHYLMLYRGATIAYAANLESVAKNMTEVRPTVMAGVPRFYEKMHARIHDSIRTSSAFKRCLVGWALKVGKETNRYTYAKQPIPLGVRLQRVLANVLVFSKLKQKLGGKLRFFISGGAPLAAELADFFFLSGILILEGYGLTETSPVIAVNRPTNFKFGSVGLPLANVDLSIAPDGEILTRGPAVMKGYYGKPEETREAMADGWFHTGDIGRIDEEGFLIITDRKKDIIITASGKNVAPQKIENLLKSNPEFLHVVVVGNRRPYLSALVVPDPNRLQETAQTLGVQGAPIHRLVQDPKIYQHTMQQIQAAGTGLASFEQIKQVILLDHDFTIEGGELTPTMKVRRRQVETKYKEQIDQLYREAE
ncbi:MAG: long-chain fatty acid--CoA ligase [Terriglobia bacterium]